MDFRSEPEINISSHAKNLNNFDFHICDWITIPDFTTLSYKQKKPLIKEALKQTW